MERITMDKETDNAKDDELDTKENTEMERITMDKETDNAKDDELNTKENTEMERKHGDGTDYNGGKETE